MIHAKRKKPQEDGKFQFALLLGWVRAIDLQLWGTTLLEKSLDSELPQNCVGLLIVIPCGWRS